METCSKTYLPLLHPKAIKDRRSLQINRKWGCSERGISLLETVLVLAILGILGGYAVSSYHRYYERGYRLAAVTAIYKAALFIEKTREEDPKGILRSLPADLKYVPQHGTAAYTLHVQAENVQNGGYSIIAQPLENGPMRQDRCGSYQLDAIGRRNNPHARDSTQDTLALCWLGRAAR